MFSAFPIQIPIFFSSDIVMPTESIIIDLKSVSGAILLGMAGCHVIAVLTVILRAVPFDVGQTVALEATEDCPLPGVGIGMEDWSGCGWYQLSRSCCGNGWLGINFIWVVKASMEFGLNDGVEVVIDLLLEGVFLFF